MFFLLFLHLIFKISSAVEDPCRPETPFQELVETVPDVQKTWIYYIVISCFVLTAIASTLLTGAFLVMSVALWNHLKTMKFFWFLTQLTFSSFMISNLNFFNVPATLLSVSTKQLIPSELYFIVLYLMDFFLHSILFSNLVIAFQRLFVFFPSKKNGISFWNLENVIQVGIPVVILVLYIALVIRVIKLKRSKRNTHEIIIVKQAFFIFVMFQIYYIVTLFGKTLYINVATAFYLKRAIHTAEIFAGAATPCIVFSTSREIRKIVSSRIGDGSAGKVPSTIKGISFRQS